ncbi:MAG TPA: tryptophan synthase subunit alpha, partial [bacterium]
GIRLIDGTFKRLRAERRAALMPFIVAGDPRGDVTPDLLLALQEGGADLIELGIPFSDPLADGPVIQAASARALARGMTPARALAALAAARGRLRVPVVVLTYWNPVLQFGGNPGAFVEAAAASGAAGLIVPDLPVEEGRAFAALAARRGVAPVFLASPTSTPERLRLIAELSRGFIYYVSVTGTTGVRRRLPAELGTGVRRLARMTRTPICVGFGIATSAQAAAVARAADGVIVGSALVARLARTSGRAAAGRAAADFVRRLRRGV